MSRAVRPYLVAASDAVTFSGWTVTRDGQTSPLQDVLPDWDYDTDLYLSGVLDIDNDLLGDSTGITPGDELRVTVAWRSVDGRIGSTVAATRVGGRTQVPVAGVLAGGDLGPEIDIWARVVLGQDLDRNTVGAARLAGSVLWEHSTRLILAGDAARFPVSVVDFNAAGLDPDAGWVLQVPERLESPVLGELILLLNARDTELVQALTGPTPDAVRMGTVFERVTVDLLEHAVARADELDDEALVPGTFGAVLVALTSRVHGGARALSTLRDQHPVKYKTVLAGEARRNGARGALP